MLKIIAIGGGEIGRPGYPVETTKIDKEIIKLSGKKQPRLLFIPTASSDSQLYAEAVKKHFGKRLGCRVENLFLIGNKINRQEPAQKILNADIIYVGGGNTLKMMQIWRKHGVDKLLRQAAGKGIVLAGVSAGSICWFKSGLSDSRKFKNPKADYIKVKGLSLINSVHCPHYHSEKGRISGLKKLMKKTTGIAIALDNCCALEILGNDYKIITSSKQAKAYLVYWQKNKYLQKEIIQTNKFLTLSNLTI